MPISERTLKNLLTMADGWPGIKPTRKNKQEITMMTIAIKYHLPVTSRKVMTVTNKKVVIMKMRIVIKIHLKLLRFLRDFFAVNRGRINSEEGNRIDYLNRSHEKLK